LALGHSVKAALQFSHFVGGVIGSCDHARALTSLHNRDQSRAPALGQPSRTAPAVLWTPRTPARHAPLSPSAYRDRQRPTWAAGTGLSCSAPIPARRDRMPASLPRGRPAALRVRRSRRAGIAFAVK
jgi:hypothetical protein